MAEKKINSFSDTVDLNGFSPKVYVIKLQLNNGASLVKRIVKI